MTKNVGKIWSHPDESGRHKLKCPSCKTVFLSVIRKDEKTDEIFDITCPECSHKDKPLLFLHELNKEKELEMLREAALKEVQKALKKLK